MRIISRGKIEYFFFFFLRQVENAKNQNKSVTDNLHLLPFVIKQVYQFHMQKLPAQPPHLNPPFPEILIYGTGYTVKHKIEFTRLGISGPFFLHSGGGSCGEANDTKQY